MSRPKKTKNKQADNRLPRELNRGTVEHWLSVFHFAKQKFRHGNFPNTEEIWMILNPDRHSRVDRLAVDPLGDFTSSSVFAPLVMKTATENQRKLAGDFMVFVIENLGAEALKLLCKEIVDMKRNSTMEHRSKNLYLAYSVFVSEFGFEPTKKRLKKYVLEKNSRFKDMPDKHDSKGWNRLWLQAGLQKLG